MHNINLHKISFHCRKTQPKEGEVVKREPKARPLPRTPHPRNVQDPQAIRTIVVSGLPSSIDSKTLWKKIRKYEGAQTVEWPAKAENGVEDSSTGEDIFIFHLLLDNSDCVLAHVLFTTSASAQEAVNKLHAHVFKGSLLSVTLKKRLDSLAKAPSKQASTKTKTSAPNRASRLIVRNLPFDITEQDLRAIFLPYGPVHSIHIPTGEADGEGKKAKAKGFAFVWMLSKKDAEIALEKCNGMAVKAGIAEVMATDKQKKKKVRREEKKRQEAVKVEDGEKVKEDQDRPTEERVIAVDWALSKEKWQEEQAKMDIDDEGDADTASVKSEDASDSGSDEGSNDDENLGVHIESGEEQDTSDDEDDMDIEAGDEKPAKPQLPPPETGTTLFVRNVPFAATEDELRTLYVFYFIMCQCFCP
jgi:nucleolar protein 4